MRLLGDDDLARLRARTADPGFARPWRAVRAAADRALTSRLRPPVEGAGWTHDYFCPEHGTRLVFDPDRPQAHRCRTDGEILTGEPFDGAWRAVVNSGLADGMLACALCWAGTGSDAYRQHALDLLREYADRYPVYPVHGEHAGRGRCMGQSLDEATWGIPVTRAYDLLRDTLDPAERDRLEARLIRPLGEHLHGQLWRRVHNIECWHLAGLATVGVALGEPDFLAPARAADFGLPGQLRDGVGEDGWWYEGSASYHFYTMRALLPLLAAMRVTDPGMVDQPRLRAMFTAPLQLARSDLTLPALNDGWASVTTPPGLGAYAPVYEHAWELWRDPDHARLLRAVYDGGVARDSVEALLSGPELAAGQPGRAPAEPSSRTFEPSGYAVLRDGPADAQRWILLKYGAHGGGHGHPDKLSVDLHAFGERLAPDLGTTGYGVPLTRTWYRHTLAHNTVLVGGESQPPVTGRLVRFADPLAAAVGVAEAMVGWPDTPDSGSYAGVTARRCLLRLPGAAPYLLDVVVVEAPEPRPIDLAWHHLGVLGDPEPAGLPAVPWNPADETYALLTDTRALPGPEWYAQWRLGPAPGAGTRMWGLDPVGGAAIVALAPSNPPAELMPFLLRRVTARRAMFAAVLEPVRGEGAVTAVRWERPDEGTVRVVVETRGSADGWRIDHGSLAVADPAVALGWTREPLPS